LKADTLLAERAAWLSKADLLTGMVGEFPELQGFMGRYYALHDGEPREVAGRRSRRTTGRAFAGDHLPDGMISCSVAVADKLDALAGLFGIGQAPTGERDPFGLPPRGAGRGSHPGPSAGWSCPLFEARKARRRRELHLRAPRAAISRSAATRQWKSIRCSA